MKHLLEDSKNQLLKPSIEARRKLMIVLNIGYIVLVSFFLISEKILLGRFTPTPLLLYFVYLPAIIANLFSAIYNIKALLFLRGKIVIQQGFWKSLIVDNLSKYDKLTSWGSFGLVMYMSITSMNGLGNPSTDSILTDFALGHSLIIMAVIIIGRKGAFMWFLIVLFSLIYQTYKLGFNYKYHYLTPTEVTKYEMALSKGENWALKRDKELKDNSLNPPSVARYFNTWLIFILVAFLGSYFFSGITIDILKVIPPVIDKIESAIQNTIRIENEIQKSTLKILHNNQLMDEVKVEFLKLDLNDRKNLAGIMNALKTALNNDEDWDNFKINYDTLHSNFFKYLESQYKELTQTEIKHLAYIKMNLENREIAKLFDINVDSLKTYRHRIKRKLGIGKDEDLRAFVNSINVIEPNVMDKKKS